MYDDCELYELALKDGSVLHIAHITADAKGSFDTDLKQSRRTNSGSQEKQDNYPPESRCSENSEKESPAPSETPRYIYVVEESRRYAEGQEIEKNWVGAYVTLEDANNMAIRVGRACETKYQLEAGGGHWHKDFKDGCISLECEINDGEEVDQIFVEKLLLHPAGSVPKLPKSKKRNKREVYSSSSL